MPSASDRNQTMKIFMLSQRKKQKYNLKMQKFSLKPSVTISLMPEIVCLNTNKHKKRFILNRLYFLRFDFIVYNLTIEHSTNIMIQKKAINYVISI